MGPYCSECGQRHHEHPVHSFWHFVQEATEDITHADSRLWQTLIALLFRPGFLTKEFLEGRRARYLPPVRLYLVVSVIFFLIAGIQSRVTPTPGVMVVARPGSLQYRVVPPRTAGHPGAVPSPVATQQLCGKVLLPAWLARFQPRVTQSCFAATAVGGIERLEQAFQHNLERAMFLFLPLLALVMKALYHKPTRYYVEHLLFFLHNHAFLFVMLGIDTLLEMTTRAGAVLNIAGAVLAVYLPVYFYVSMRRVYGQSRPRTLGKLVALSFVYLILAGTIVSATATYSFLML